MTIGIVFNHKYNIYVGNLQHPSTILALPYIINNSKQERPCQSTIGIDFTIQFPVFQAILIRDKRDLDLAAQ